MEVPTERNKSTEPTRRGEHTIGVQDWGPATRCCVPNQQQMAGRTGELEKNDVG